ncbi:MAG: sensor histidine kinase [Bryobacteraceae bacterium]|nr:sensor histidine kinase [Bryobacteraceae bacterium]
MQPATVHSGLADTANILSGQLRAQLGRLARLLKPRAEALDARFSARLQELRFAPRERSALAALTPGAAARVVGRGANLQTFLEQVEYNGRRLAKLNLPPGDVVRALAEYDRLLAPLLTGLAGQVQRDYQWVREQLQFLVTLTLNHAYYLVREKEAQAFYELFRVELDARNLEQLARGALQALTRFSNAEEAHFFLLDQQRSAWVLKATVPGPAARSTAEPPPAPYAAARNRQLLRPRSARAVGRSAASVLDPTWPERFAWTWSVPLVSGRQVAGLMQFAFAKRYDWFPREQELLQAAAERCLAAAEKARLIEDLAAREEQVRRLAEHMLHIEEVERRRISRELHDEAGQSMLYIRLQLEMLEKEIPAEHQRWRSRLEGVRQVTENTILETRRLIGALSPAVLEQLGLAPAVRQLANRLRQAYPCQVELHLSHLERLPKRIETIVYRLVQECCNNILKHSRASHVNISVSSADGILRLSVEDDGVGFSVTEALNKNDSFGLAGMRERVTLLGGRFFVQSSPGGRGRIASGARIIAELPIPRERTDAEAEPPEFRRYVPFFEGRQPLPAAS